VGTQNPAGDSSATGARCLGQGLPTFLAMDVQGEKQQCRGDGQNDNQADEQQS
jgi:hypothetical protein